jgi:hypothetical protein
MCIRVLDAITHRNVLPEAIVFSSEYLRCYVVGCSTECGCSVARPDPFFTHSIISQLDMAFMVK